MDLWIDGKNAASDEVTKDDLIAALKEKRIYQDGYDAGMEAAMHLLAALNLKARP